MGIHTLNHHILVGSSLIVRCTAFFSKTRRDYHKRSFLAISYLYGSVVKLWTLSFFFKRTSNFKSDSAVPLLKTR